MPACSNWLRKKVALYLLYMTKTANLYSRLLQHIKHLVCMLSLYFSFHLIVVGIHSDSTSCFPVYSTSAVFLNLSVNKSNLICFKYSYIFACFLDHYAVDNVQVSSMQNSKMLRFPVMAWFPSDAEVFCLLTVFHSINLM
jgi:hypothetical protein